MNMLLGYDEDTISILFVMHQRFSEKSFFKDYFKILPESPNAPILFDFSELMELDGTPIFEEVIEVKEQLRFLQSLHLSNH